MFLHLFYTNRALYYDIVVYIVVICIYNVHSDLLHVCKWAGPM